MTIAESSVPQTPDITINNTTLDIGEDVNVINEAFTGNAGTGVILTLANTPVSGFDIIVHINGVLQKETTHYTVSGTSVTIVGTIVAADTVIVRYAYEV